jgi:hypothetical protein
MYAGLQGGPEKIFPFRHLDGDLVRLESDALSHR